MTDAETTKIIAEKVMGWELTVNPFGWWITKNNECNADSFRPLQSDSDCMMAWDKFSETEATSLGHGHNSSSGYPGWAWFANDGEHYAVNSDRRRAMCECMVKAVTNPNGKGDCHDES